MTNDQLSSGEGERADDVQTGWTGRRAARARVIRALYQWQLSQNALLNRSVFDPTEDFDKVYFKRIWKGVIQHIEVIDSRLKAAIDRSIQSLTPVELAVLRLGIYELMHESDVPSKVIINEALELSKMYGTTEGFKYVNGVLDKLAVEIRGTPEAEA